MKTHVAYTPRAWREYSRRAAAGVMPGPGVEVTIAEDASIVRQAMLEGRVAPPTAPDDTMGWSSTDDQRYARRVARLIREDAAGQELGASGASYRTHLALALADGQHFTLPALPDGADVEDVEDIIHGWSSGLIDPQDRYASCECSRCASHTGDGGRVA